MVKIKKELNEIVLIGARIDGQAGVVLDALERMGKHKVIGFVDNSPSLQGKKVDGIPVLGSSDDLSTLDLPTDSVHLSIGDNIARFELYKLLKSRKFKFVRIIHPHATVSQRAVIGEGCFVGARAVISKGVKIGKVSIINTGAILEHDDIIGNAVHIAPGVKTAGRAKVDDYAFLGIGSTILPDIHIGSGSMVGAGAVVTKDVEKKSTMIGYAAIPHKKSIYHLVVPDIGEVSPIYIAQPTIPAYESLEGKFKDILKTKMLSNFSKYSNELEFKIQNKFDVKRALTLPNCTSSLMLAIKAMEISGEVILPSFTFSATGHSVIWNGLKPIFADIKPNTFNIDPEDVERKITEKTSAILAVNIFGNPCEIEELQLISNKYKVKLIFDSAHALGSMYKGKMMGIFGDIEAFSLSGTKVITSAEGGILTSNNIELMEKISLGRNYGSGSNYNCEFIGINGKMSEFHASIAIESLNLLDDLIENRNKIANLYKQRLSELPGISFQHVSENDISTYKDFGVIIDAKNFGINRDKLINELEKESIYTKKYFFPPLHQMLAYKKYCKSSTNLHNTDYVSLNIICLPIYSHMNIDTVDKICFAIHRIWENVNNN